MDVPAENAEKMYCATHQQQIMIDADHIMDKEFKNVNISEKNLQVSVGKKSAPAPRRTYPFPAPCPPVMPSTPPFVPPTPFAAAPPSPGVPKAFLNNPSTTTAACFAYSPCS